MKKFLSAFFLLLVLPSAVSAQILNLEYVGDGFPEVYARRINKTLTKEMEFYGPLILQDTISVKIRVFGDKDRANAFIRQFKPVAYGNYCSGMFIREIQTAVVITTEDTDRSLGTLFHETSHFLYHKAMDGFASGSLGTAYSLNEGLACYFSYLRVKKDGSVYLSGDKYYVSSVKTLIDIDEFNLDEYLSMNHSGFSDRHRHDGGSSYRVSYVIVATLFDKLGTEGMRRLLAMIRDGSKYSEAVESLYPGGRAVLETDIRTFVNKRR